MGHKTTSDERYDLRLPNGRLHQKPSAKGGKRLASRNPRVLCLKYGGACTMYYLAVPKVRETGRKIGFLCSQERVRRN